MAYWAAHNPNRTKFEADQNGQIQVLILFAFYNFAQVTIAYTIVRSARIQQNFRLNKNFVAKTEVRTKLGAEFEIFHTEVERRIGNYADIRWLLNLSVDASFQTKRKELGVCGAAKEHE